MERTPGEIARALEIVLSSLKMDRETARIMQSHLDHQRKIMAAMNARIIAEACSRRKAK